MRNKFALQPGHEVRGMMIRLYPDAETEQKLLVLSERLRRCWNWLVGQTEDVIRAREAYAVRCGLVPVRPLRPDYDGMAPDEAKVAKSDHRAACANWSHAVHLATKDDPSCAFRTLKEWMQHLSCGGRADVRHDYQLFSRVCPEDNAAVRPCAHAYQSLVKNYFTKGAGQRRKTFRRKGEVMPLQVRSGDCFSCGSFGDRGGKTGWYNCQVKFNGLKIRWRLPGRAPWGRVLEGVSITRQADGWWASIKQEIPIRQIPDAVPGSVVGIDVGLDNMAAIAGTVEKRIENRRGKEYADMIAGRQAQKKEVGRLQQRAARHARHVIYNEIVKPLATVETVKVERLPKTIGQMGSSKASSMRTVVAILMDRYGSRVREVDPCYTSQDCSQCGHRSKESWGYEHGRIGQCPICGHREDRDLNAARNIARKEPLPLEVPDAA